MSRLNLFFLFLTSLSVAAACTSAKVRNHQGLPPYKPESKDFFEAIVRQDSLLFDAYNTCKPEVFEALIAEDIEFYHDRGGLSTSKKELLEGLRNNICGKVRRELLKGSIEVYRIPGYGAVQIGVHRFYNRQEKAAGHYARFVHTWRQENQQWKLTRVISLH